MCVCALRGVWLKKGREPLVYIFIYTSGSLPFLTNMTYISHSQDIDPQNGDFGRRVNFA